MRGPVAAVLVLALSPAAGLATESPSYAVTVSDTENGPLDQAIRDSSTLLTLKESAPVSGFALISRARSDLDRLKTALESQGYYDGQAVIRIAGHDLDDEALPGILETLPSDTAVPVTVAVESGPLYHLRAITLDGSIPDDVRAQLAPLAPGVPAVAADILAAQARLLDRLRADSYALATVSSPIATEDPASHSLDVTFTVVPGPPLNIGTIALTGLSGVDPAFIRQRLLVHQGEKFSPATVETARRDLVATGLFSSVAATLGEIPDDRGALPLTFAFVEREKHLVGFTAAYSTDLGGSLGTTWTDRNMLGAGQQLSLHAKGTGFGGSDTQAPGYDVGGEWLLPDFRRRSQSLAFAVNGVREFLDAYDRTGVTARTTLKRKFESPWTLSFGLGSTTEKITQEGSTTSYELITLPIALSFDNTDSPITPTNGLRATLTVTPTYAFGPQDVPYLVTEAKGSTYFDLGTPGRSVLALRGLVGSANGASLADLPPDGRFYGGGSATVRGYKFQSIGPHFADGKPVGGLAVDTATIEIRQHLYEDIAGVVFVDAGQVSADTMPFVGMVRYGAGLGVRYTTPIGPLRLDIAAPLNRQKNDASFEIYMGIGEAF